MVGRLLGLGWLPLEEVASQKRQLVTGNGVTVTTSRNQHPDVITLAAEDPHAVMKCGHAICKTKISQWAAKDGLTDG